MRLCAARNSVAAVATAVACATRANKKRIYDRRARCYYGARPKTHKPLFILSIIHHFVTAQYESTAQRKHETGKPSVGVAPTTLETL